MQRGVAHVGVYQQHALAQLRQVDGKGQRRGGFALGLIAAGHHQPARRTFGRRKLQGRPHGAVGLGKSAARVLDREQRQGTPLDQFLFHERDNAQQWQAELGFDFVGALDGVIELFTYENETHAQQQSCEQADPGVLQEVGRDGEQWHVGFVDDGDVVGRDAAGDAHLFEPLQQAVINLAVGVEFALEQVQVDTLVLRNQHLAAGLLQAHTYLVFLPLGCIVLTLH